MSDDDISDFKRIMINHYHDHGRQNKKKPFVLLEFLSFNLNNSCPTDSKFIRTLNHIGTFCLAFCQSDFLEINSQVLKIYEVRATAQSRHSSFLTYASFS